MSRLTAARAGTVRALTVLCRNLGGLRVRSFVLAGAFMAVGQTAAAQLTVDKMWMDFEAGASGREDVLLRNESDRRYYISIEPAEIVNPGKPDEQRVEIENPEELGLLISPNRLILEPGEFRALRIVSINDTLDRDRIYRVRVTPKIGAITGPEAQGDERNANLVVLMAYDLLVTVRPRDGKAEIEARRDSGTLTLRNTGSSNTLLVDGKACPPAAPEDSCAALPDTRLYAGSEVSFPLPAANAEVRFKARDTTFSNPRQLVY